MREDAVPDDESSDAVERLIQRRWNQFANPNRSVHSGSSPTFLYLTRPISTDRAGSQRQRRARLFLVREVKSRDDKVKPQE